MTTWIFLRGLTRESRHWGEFVDQFQRVMPHQTVVTLDLAGNGRLNHQRSASRVEDMVLDCRLQLALRHIAPPYHLLAMSLGAMVGVAWAQSRPEEVAAQVLINTSLRPFSPFYQRLRPANYARLLRLLLPMPRRLPAKTKTQNLLQNLPQNLLRRNNAFSPAPAAHVLGTGHGPLFMGPR